MSDKPKLAKNVLEMIGKCSRTIGLRAAEHFDQDLWANCMELDMGSPIEQILYCAIKTLAEINDIEPDNPELVNGKWEILGLRIDPQKVIDKYRVDFFISYCDSNTKTNQITHSKEVVVDCDGHQFHERTEKERRYEKARDRYLQKKGYRVFHYTGSEIVKDPFPLAAEILAEVLPENWNVDELLTDFFMYEAE